ncbi:Thiamin (Thiazole moiety) biosynthesis protein [Candidatus Terasakiella magnetica]|uniref:Molybdopterin-synthase adenylyltransferase n=1 Tax=Candidatus Terasakiella magnetica TaxID=1867952 RepID=A0A1C3RFB8_9PROT|nr:molybdopterin-synthase adenylyltransferase MoeB [Candidatus Terasakiella magnetica]SCA55959.1 Thiamin (Thiazole moiety) biosynthesis protein [Candidatus Terasakiella magnetica]
MDFNEEQLERYARHILLPEVGGVGQSKLLNAKVLVVGAGGLGAPVLLYLAAAGVGTIGIIDDDVVDLSNLQRQIIHSTQTIDVAKVESAKESLLSINPALNINLYQERLNTGNINSIISQYDIVADGTDNFATRFLINDACYFAKKTLVSAAILRFDGQLSTYKAHLEGEDKPCYRCIFREPPPPGQVPTCSEAGVLGAICGTMGSLQATEILKEIMGIGQSMSGTLMIYDALHSEFRNVKVKRDKGCPLCGENPTITDLSVHNQ